MPRQRYEKVADDLRRKIESGEYPPGSRLPTRAELGKMYDASDTVIDKAMMILRMAGLTESLPGVGVYVAERPPPP
jgi:GntR family transcriptional regulator